MHASPETSREGSDAPVPQLVENVTDTLRILDLPIAEQVIVVPNISCSPCPSRSRVPEAAVSGSVGGSAELLCVSRSRSSAFQFLGVVFKVFSQYRVQQRRLPRWNAFLSRLWSRSLTFLLEVALGRGLPHQLVLQMRILLGGFPNIPPSSQKSAKLASHSSPRVPTSGSPSTPAAQLEVAPLPDSLEWVQLRDGNSGKTYCWNRRTRKSVWKPLPGVKVVWVGELTEEGRVRYWHRDTRVSALDLPPLPPG